MFIGVIRIDTSRCRFPGYGATAWWRRSTVVDVAGLAVQVRLGQWWDITILLYYGVLMAYSWILMESSILMGYSWDLM